MNQYSHFEEKGYRIEAHIPTNDDDIDAFEIRVLIAGELKKTLYLPINYLPVFGVDVGDIHKLEAFADAMMEVLPEAATYDDAASLALDTIEEKFGGAAIRQRLAKPSTRVGVGQFEWTRDAFVSTIADVLGGRVAAENWMNSAKVELDNRTPEEALRLGMAQEVIALLAQQTKAEG